MRKMIIWALLSCLLLAGCKQDPEPTTTPTETAVPTEATVPADPTTKTIRIRTSLTTCSGDNETRTEYILDEQDQVREVKIYTNGQLTQSYAVQCDEHGNYILWTGETAQLRYTYDQGRLTGYSSYHGDTLISTTTYTWEDGLMTCITQKMPGQSAEHRADMTYDKNGDLLRQDDYLGGTLQSYCVYTLGSDGKPTAATTYMADGTVLQVDAYTYEGDTVTITADNGKRVCKTMDASGDLLCTVEYGPDGSEVFRQETTWKTIQVPIHSLRASV